MKKILKKHLNKKHRRLIGAIIRTTKHLLNRFIDIAFIPLTISTGYFLRYLRIQQFRGFTSSLPISRKILIAIGVYPIIDHFYDPLFNPKHLKRSLRENRNLSHIDFNDSEQLKILNSFNYNNELIQFPLEDPMNDNREYYYNNGIFRSGDSEFLYSMIRLFKPHKFVEIGSGCSTLMAINAIKKNISSSSDYVCEHICIDPYAEKWLERNDVKVIYKKVEELDLSFFKELDANDILFIDSSHIIRSQGDVLFEYLEILPNLKKGVLVHIHDIFTPKDYLDEWFGKYFWNEQYLLEAFLSFNKEFRIVGATNYLSHKYNEQFASKCPIFKSQKGREAASFWIVKNL